MMSFRTKIKQVIAGPRRNTLIALISTFVIVGVGYTVYQTSAAGFFSATEPEQGTLTGNAQVVTDSNASGGKALQFNAPAAPPSGGGGTGTTTCPLPKYPYNACTGVPAGTGLTTYSGDYNANVAGATITNLHITGGINILANNITIKNSQIDGPIINDPSTAANRHFTVADSTVGPANGCSTYSAGGIGVANYTVSRVRLRGFSDGFRVAGSNVLIEDSYATLCSTNPNDHSDGIQAYGASGGTNITIRHNTIDQTAVPDGQQTAPIFIPLDSANQGNDGITVNIMDNLLAGGGYSLRLFGTLPFSAPQVTGNKVVNNSWQYGPFDLTCTNIGTWSGNATVNYDFSTGTITSQVKAFPTC